MASPTAFWMRRVAAAAGAVTIAFTGTPVAGATPVPRQEEWWFSMWDIQNKVWPISTGQGVTVAVIDSGVNARLPDLASAVLPGTDLTEHKGDGRTDYDPDLGGHGTAMAALIAGQGPTMAGVAPGARILPVTILRKDTGGMSNDAKDNAIRYAARHGAKVISMSISIANVDGPLRCDPITQSAVDYAVKRDVVLVASAGNDGDTAGNGPESPAACPGVLAVGAVDSHARPWVKTQREPYVAVAAPGVDAGSIGRAGVFTNNSGTSTSTALAAGAVALVRAKFPKMSGREVVQRIIASALDTGPRGVDLQTGYGVLRPYHALTDRVPANAPNPVYDRWDQEQRQQSGSATPAASPSKPAAAERDDKSGGPPIALISGIGLGVLCVLAGVVAFLVRRRGRRGVLG